MKQLFINDNPQQIFTDEKSNTKLEQYLLKDWTNGTAIELVEWNAQSVKFKLYHMIMEFKEVKANII